MVQIDPHHLVYGGQVVVDLIVYTMYPFPGSIVLEVFGKNLYMGYRRHFAQIKPYVSGGVVIRRI